MNKKTIEMSTRQRLKRVRECPAIRRDSENKGKNSQYDPELQHYEINQLKQEKCTLKGQEVFE